MFGLSIPFRSPDIRPIAGTIVAQHRFSPLNRRHIGIDDGGRHTLRHLAEQPRFLHDSFEAIVAYQGNAALPHYRPGASEVVLKPRGVLLVDSGGTYRDGTTDTTRVHALGPVGDVVRRNCTLVLKGVISLTQARFPRDSFTIPLRM